MFSEDSMLSAEVDGWIMADWDRHIELSRLRDIDLLELAVELTNTASRFVNQRAPELPPLHWSLDTDCLSGRVDEDQYSDPEGVAQQWRKAFALEDGADNSYGTRKFEGVLDGKRLKIWYIKDRARFRRY